MLHVLDRNDPPRSRHPSAPSGIERDAVFLYATNPGDDQVWREALTQVRTKLVRKCSLPGQSHKVLNRRREGEIPSHSPLSGSAGVTEFGAPVRIGDRSPSSSGCSKPDVSLGCSKGPVSSGHRSCVFSVGTGGDAEVVISVQPTRLGAQDSGQETHRPADIDWRRVAHRDCRRHGNALAILSDAGDSWNASGAMACSKPHRAQARLAHS
jgi:hypothetical protein